MLTGVSCLNRKRGGKLTCFSSPLSAFHSSATSLLFSLRTIPLKSVLWIRSLKKKVQAELGRFTRRSSSMCWVWLGVIGTLRAPPKALFLTSLLFSLERALLARRISSGVCDSTQALYSAARASVRSAAMWLYFCRGYQSMLLAGRTLGITSRSAGEMVFHWAPILASEARDSSTVPPAFPLSAR